MTAHPPEETFEAMYQRLDEIVRRLQDGGLTLEESLSLYEEGMRLAGRCQEMLDAAELRVTELHQSLRAAEPDEFADEGEGPEDED